MFDAFLGQQEGWVWFSGGPFPPHVASDSFHISPASGLGQTIHLDPPTTRRDTTLGSLLDFGDNTKYTWGNASNHFSDDWEDFSGAQRKTGHWNK